MLRNEDCTDVRADDITHPEDWAKDSAQIICARCGMLSITINKAALIEAKANGQSLICECRRGCGEVVVAPMPEASSPGWLKIGVGWRQPELTAATA